MLRFQSTAGNSAARRLLRGAHGGSEPTGTRVSRNPDDPFDREDIKRIIGDRLAFAYTKFANACSEKQRALREAVADQATVAGAVLDVVFAFVSPGLGRLVTRAARSARTSRFARLAEGALDRSEQIVAASTAVGKSAAVEGFKRVIARTETENFVQDLKQEASVAFDRINNTLHEKTDEELGILYFNYDPEIVDVDHYEREVDAMVRRYQAQVEPMGTKTIEVDPQLGAGAVSYSTHAVWVPVPRGTFLALVTASSAGYGRTNYVLENWVSRQMKTTAIEKTRQVTGAEPSRMPPDQIRGISSAVLEGDRAPLARR